MSTFPGLIDSNRGLAAGFTIPYRDPVTPPKLAADAPITDILHPVQIDLGELLGDDGYPSFPHSLNSRFG